MENRRFVVSTVLLNLSRQDHDHDGRLSVSDYEESVKNEPLLLEAFGPCLPNKKVCVCGGGI